MPDAVTIRAPGHREALNARGKLLFHRLAAARLARQPELLNEVRGIVAGWRDAGFVESYVFEWGELLRGSVPDIRRNLTSRSDLMYRLRNSSPFAVAPSFVIRDDALRRKLWLIARSRAPEPWEIWSARSGGHLQHVVTQ